jgi:hypothetical protein
LGVGVRIMVIVKVMVIGMDGGIIVRIKVRVFTE